MEAGRSRDDVWREAFLWVCENSPPLFPYHRSPDGSRLVDRIGVEASISAAW